MNHIEARQAWAQDSAIFKQRGIFLPDVVSYVPEGFNSDFNYAMDAQAPLVTTPNAGIPSFLTTMIDPTVFEILLSPLKGAEILGEVRKGTWLDQTMLFPTMERTGEVTSYGDFNEDGATGVNAQWPNRQSYLFQTVKQYGELEIERAALGRIGWVAEIDRAAANALMRAMNYSYHFGVNELENYGLLNDPALNAALTPGTKAYGGNKWVVNNVIVATANEIYLDIESLYIQLVSQTAGVVDGIVDQNMKLTLALAPQVSVALTATNSFNVNVADLLKKNFPNITVVTDVLYGTTSAQNPQGLAAGNLVQMIAPSVGGQDCGYCAYNEKMRTHPIIRAMSSYRQKVTAGTWGAIIRQPFAIAQMLGV